MTKDPAAGAIAPAADLSPFVPRLVPEWMREAPSATHRRVDGTLVFTDLSGFTAMSERLAALGKVGAEELTQHLDATFTELVSVSGTYGGTMLKFGGDALLIFFWGTEHPLRAARAALEMQRTLHRIGTILTSAGTFQLKMTVGAHAAPVDFFLVGSSHRELYVCGPAASTTVHTEGQAESGEIRLSPELAGLVDPRLVDRALDPPLLSGEPPVEPAFVSMSPWPRGSAPRLFVPEMLRNHLRSGVELHEHRQMSVGFLHLSNVDELIDEVGPDITAAHLHDLTVHVQKVFASHGVAFVSTDVYEGGPKVICASGAVRTFGNDDESLLRALREIVDYPSAIELKVGVNRGHGFCGYVGPPFRRTFVTIGDVVNTAARVMSKAGSGDILATSGVLERSETTFETTELPPFAAKGKSEPLIAFRVGEVSGTRAPAERTQLPIVGRDEELEVLDTAVEHLADGRGSFIEIRGDTGVGKTRLIEEARSRTELAYVEARCGRYAGSTPYFPFRSLLAGLLEGEGPDGLIRHVRESAPDLEPYFPLLALVIGHTAPPTPEVEALSISDQRTKLHESVAALITALVRSPAVWVVEDAHWIDAASADLLRHLAGDASALPLLLIVSGRPDDADPIGSPDQRMELGPLDGDAARALVRTASPRPLLPREVDHLVERSHGNPYFLVELAGALTDERDLERLPDSLEALVAAKIDGLDPAERVVLRQLAVVGGRFEPHIARTAVAGLPEDTDPSWERLDEFVDRSQTPWRFRQAVIRDTAYEGLSYRERREVHLRTGEAFEQLSEDPSLVCELLSLHFHAAEDHDRALRYSLQAAEKARLAYASAEAATFYRRCVDASRALEDRVELGDALTGLGEAEYDQGHYAAAKAFYQEALGIKRDLDNISGVGAQLNSLGLVARGLGEYDEALRLFEESLDVLRPLGSEDKVGSVLTNIGTILLLKGNYAGAREWFERSRTFFEERGDAKGLASSVETLGTVAFVLGELDEATQRYEEVVALHRASGYLPGLGTVLNNLGNVAFQRGDYPAARARYEESLEIRREIGDRYGVSSALGNLGTVAYFEQDYEVSRANYLEALAIGREIGDKRGVAQCLHNLSEIAIVNDEPLEARGLCEEGLRIRRELGDVRGIAESLTTMGNICWDLEDYGRARPYYLEALELLVELGNRSGLAECLEAVAATSGALGDATTAATLLGVADALIESSGAARTWSPGKREALQRRLADDLQEPVLQMAMDVGRAMTPERALEFAKGFLAGDDEAETESA